MVACVRSPGALAVPYGVTSTDGVGIQLLSTPHVHFTVALHPNITM